jgi:hypothetical protein
VKVTVLPSATRTRVARIRVGVLYLDGINIIPSYTNETLSILKLFKYVFHMLADLTRRAEGTSGHTVVYGTGTHNCPLWLMSADDVLTLDSKDHDLMHDEDVI